MATAFQANAFQNNAFQIVSATAVGNSYLPDGGGDEASIAYWRKRQLEQNEAVQKITRDAIKGIAESDRHDDVSVAEETAEQLVDVIASFAPATASAGDLQRFAEMLEDEEDVELLLALS